MRRTTPVLGLLLGLLAALVGVPNAAVGAAAGASGSVRATAPATADEVPFEPDLGAIFNDPRSRRAGRVIVREVVRSIEATEPGEAIRIATWNFDDRPTRVALVTAAERGVEVHVVVAGAVDSENWDALRLVLNHDHNAATSAVRCHGGCRSRSPIMHTKLFLFSRLGDTEHVTMFGSSNLTTPARRRQWNDQIATESKEVYTYFTRIFDEYAQDEAVPEPFEVTSHGDFRIWVFPIDRGNPQAEQLERVRCHGATGRTGTRDGRTKIRLAIAGWFDTYGQEIADQLRRLSDRGCDVKVVTTLAGGGINRTLGATSGRGPVPIRQLARDLDGDGIPDRYLHQKSMAISGVFAGDTSASVVFTGSPNWSTRAAHSDEIWVRVLDRPRLTRHYLRRFTHLFALATSGRQLTPAELQRALRVHARAASGAEALAGFELD